MVDWALKINYQAMVPVLLCNVCITCSALWHFLLLCHLFVYCLPFTTGLTHWDCDCCFLPPFTHLPPGFRSYRFLCESDGKWSNNLPVVMKTFGKCSSLPIVIKPDDTMAHQSTSNHERWWYKTHRSTSSCESCWYMTHQSTSSRESCWYMTHQSTSSRESCWYMTHQSTSSCESCWYKTHQSTSSHESWWYMTH